MNDPSGNSYRAPADGEVRIGKLRDDWYFVQIGRPGRVKRFNLRDAEARQLIEQLLEMLPSGRPNGSRSRVE